MKELTKRKRKREIEIAKKIKERKNKYLTRRSEV